MLYVVARFRRLDRKPRVEPVSVEAIELNIRLVDITLLVLVDKNVDDSRDSLLLNFALGSLLVNEFSFGDMSDFT